MPAGTCYTVKKGMLSEKILNKTVNQGRHPDHYVIGIKNHFLHAVHPVGWIKRLMIELDGEEVDSTKAYLVLRGQWFHLPKIHTIGEVCWNLCEDAEIYVECEGGIRPGKHLVSCTFTMSLLEDTRILDSKNKWPHRTERVEKIMQA